MPNTDDSLKGISQLIAELQTLRARVATLEQQQTKYEKTEAALRESERMLATLLSNLPGIAYRCKNSPEWPVEYVSEGCFALTGHPASDLIQGKIPYGHVVHPDDRQMVWDTIQSAVAQHKPFQMTYRICTASGLQKWVWEQGQGVWGDQGELLAIEGFITDTTQRRQAEQSLRQWEDETRRLLDGLNGFLWTARVSPNDPQWHVNMPTGKGFERITGYMPEELFRAKGSYFSGITLEEDLARKNVAGRRAIDGEIDGYYQEFRIRHKSGQIRWLAESVRVSQRGEQGVNIIGVCMDITQRRQAEEALRKWEDETRQLMDGLDGFLWTAEVQKPWDWNMRVPATKGFERVTGYTPEEIFYTTGTCINGIAVPEDLLDKDASGRRALAGEIDGYYHEYRIHHKNGQIRWIGESVRVSSRTKDRTNLMGVSLDITGRVLAQQRNTLLAAAVDQAAETIIITDADGYIQHVNPAFVEVTGYAQEEVFGDNPRLLKSGQHDQAFYKQMWKTLSEGQVWRGHIINRKKDRTLYEADATISPVRNAGGTVTNYVAVARDVTQEAALEAQLRQAQKMEAVGRLAGGIAHDFNNLLTGILGYANMLKLSLSPKHHLYQAAGVIEQAAKRAAELTNQLLGFARKGKLQNVPVDLHAAIDEAVSLLQRTLDKNIRIARRFEADRAFVLGDPGQMQQVILNLVVNANDAMAGGGELTFHSRIAIVTDDRRPDEPLLPPGPYVMFSVQDTGCGVDPEIRGRIFDPFFTTKEPGKGTGMGLAMVYGIVKNHGGTVDVQSQPGQGTTFRVFLPLASRQAVESTPSESIQPALARGVGRILLVDDEEIVRNVTSRMLGVLGYQVTTAEDGAKALEYYRASWQEIDLVMLDMVMPGLNGRDCFRALRSINPHVRAVLSTGYGLDGTTQEVLNEGMLGFAQKPYHIQQLADVVAKAMGKLAPPA